MTSVVNYTEASQFADRSVKRKKQSSSTKHRARNRPRKRDICAKIGAVPRGCPRGKKSKFSQSKKKRVRKRKREARKGRRGECTALSLPGTKSQNDLFVSLLRRSDEDRRLEALGPSRVSLKYPNNFFHQTAARDNLRRKPVNPRHILNFKSQPPHRENRHTFSQPICSRLKTAKSEDARVKSGGGVQASARLHQPLSKFKFTISPGRRLSPRMVLLHFASWILVWSLPENGRPFQRLRKS